LRALSHDQNKLLGEVLARLAPGGTEGQPEA